MIREDGDHYDRIHETLDGRRRRRHSDRGRRRPVAESPGHWIDSQLPICPTPCEAISRQSTASPD
jgi:hypothetical protein